MACASAWPNSASRGLVCRGILWRRVSGVGRRESGVGCRASGVGCRASGVRCRLSASGVRCPASGVRRTPPPEPRRPTPSPDPAARTPSPEPAARTPSPEPRRPNPGSRGRCFSESDLESGLYHPGKDRGHFLSGSAQLGKAVSPTLWPSSDVGPSPGSESS